MAETRPRFDPYGVLQALDRQRVKYVVIGGFARVLQGTEEITRGIDIVPSVRGDNLNRLDRALQEIHAKPAGGTELEPLESSTLERARARTDERLRRLEGDPDTDRDAGLRRPSPGRPAENRSVVACAPRSPRSETSRECPRRSERNTTLLTFGSSGG